MKHRASSWHFPLKSGAILTILACCCAAYAFYAPALSHNASPAFSCPFVRIIDGDTFDCGRVRIRLQGIDAPERDGQCRPGRRCTPGDPVASTRSLKALTDSAKVTCKQTDTDAYGRTVARCAAGPIDLSCEQVRRGHAVLRYAPIQCDGR